MEFTSKNNHVCSGAWSDRCVELDGQGQVQGWSQPTAPDHSVSSIHLTRVLTLLSTSWLSEQVHFSLQCLVDMC